MLVGRGWRKNRSRKPNEHCQAKDFLFAATLLLLAGTRAR